MEYTYGRFASGRHGLASTSISGTIARVTLGKNGVISASKKGKSRAKRLYYKGRRVLTENDRKQMACPYPPEPEWVAVLETAAQRREKGGGM